MKTQTNTIVVCSLTDKPIKEGIVMAGAIHRLNSDGTIGEEILKAGEGGDAYSTEAFLKQIRGKQTAQRAPRNSVVHATTDEVVKGVKEAGVPVTVSKLAEQLKTTPNSLRKGLDDGEKSGRLVKLGRGIYQIAPQKGGKLSSASAS